MSADFPSSNPFRRKALSATSSTTTATNQSPSVPNHVTFQHHQQHQHHQNHQQQEKAPSENTQFERFDAPKLQTKPVKKVRVQSPPPSSPEADACSPTPVSSNNTSTFTYNENDPFDGALSDTSEDEKPVPRMRNVPVNPFSKTLETMEGGAAVAAPTSVVSPGRASLDVEAFKRLLMTGNSGLVSSPAPTTPIAATTPVVQPHQEGSGSSTDTSSLSRQSIFEPLHEAHPESPRTSHEISEPEDEHRGFTDYQGMSTSTKKKPPPPSSRHGKLIKMELGRDDPATSTGVSTPPTPNSAISQNYFNTSTTSLPSIRSQTDLNKPLPPAPTRASHEFDRESVFDKEAAGKTPEPPSPSASLRRKTPPAPPIARRHSQLVSESKLTRSESGRLSPRVEEDTPKIVETSSRPRSDSAKAPPPPPSRRHAGSIKGSSNQGPVSPTMNPGPPIPPTRMPSTRQRPPSVSSMEMSSTKRGAAPPPPPPHRHGRGSIDGQRPMLSPDPKTSGEYSRRSNDSGRRDSVASSITSPTDRPRTSSGDVLADLTALQREIDALRGQSEKHAAT